MGRGAALDAQEIEVLVRLARSQPFGSRVIAALLRRIVEIQDAASEAELLGLVAKVEALLANDEG